MRHSLESRRRRHQRELSRGRLGQLGERDVQPRLFVLSQLEKRMFEERDPSRWHPAPRGQVHLADIEDEPMSP